MSRCSMATSSNAIHRFPSRYALHGGPKFRPTGASSTSPRATAGSPSSIMWNLKVVAETRAGLNTRNAAVSGDGKYLDGGQLPATHAGGARCRPESADEDHPGGGTPRATRSSRVSAVYDASPRKSFVAALKDVPEVWEISYDPNAETVAEGMVHDFQYKEGSFKPGFFYPRRSFLRTARRLLLHPELRRDDGLPAATAGKGQVVQSST
jgi:hypothetical protein